MVAKSNNSSLPLISRVLDLSFCAEVIKTIIVACHSITPLECFHGINAPASGGEKSLVAIM